MSRVTKLRAHAISEELLAPDAGLEITQEGKLSALPILTQVTGGLTYKGLFDPTTGVPNPVEESAKQGWFYKVSQSGTWLGLTLNVGDNIYFNADVLPSDAEDVPSLLSKIDIIDNTESIMNLEDLHNVTSTDIVGGQGLVYNEELGEWVNQDIVYNLDDLGDVTLSETITNGQGLVYDAATEQWTNQDIVEVLDDLSDVYYDSITSSDYSNSTAVATLTINRDHILEFTAGTTGTRRIPNALNPENNYLVINNIGLGDLTLVANTNATFWAFGQPSTEPIEVPARRRVVLTGASIEYPAGSETFVTYWNVSISGISPRQSLTRVGTTAWTNGYINAYDVQGVASQGEINNIQAELNLSQASLGLLPNGSFNYFENTNFMDSATSFRSADLKLDAALKAEQTSRISADNTLQSNINAEITARANAVSAEASARIAADNTLQTNINTEANTRSTADANLQTELNNVEAAIGLSATGTLVAFTATGVVAGKLTYLDAVNTMSGEIETIRDLVAGGIDHLQAELDQTQAALGGMTAGGTFTAFAGTNYLNGAASFRAADLALDSAVKVNADAIAALQTKDAQLDTKDAALQAELDNTQASLGLTVGGTLTPFTLTGVVAGKTTHLAAIDALSTELVEVRGLVVGGVDNLNLDLTGSADPESFTGFAGTYVSAQTNFLSAIEALNDAIVAEKDASNLRMDGIDARIDGVDLTIGDLDAELGVTQGSLGNLTSLVSTMNENLGLNQDGTLAFFNTNYVFPQGTLNPLTHHSAITSLADSSYELEIRTANIENHVIYVSPSMGDDDDYNGSYAYPNKTIAGALANARARVGDTVNYNGKFTIRLAPGVYSENVLIDIPEIHIEGIRSNVNSGGQVVINGTVTIAPTADYIRPGGIYNNQIVLKGLLINAPSDGPAIACSGTLDPYQLHVDGCQLYQVHADQHCFTSTGTDGAYINFFKSAINHQSTGDGHAIYATNGAFRSVDLVQIYRQSGSAASRAIYLAGNAVANRISNCLIVATGSAATIETATNQAITIYYSGVQNISTNGSGIKLGAGSILTALYTGIDVVAGTGHVVDGVAGSAFIFAYMVYPQDVTIAAPVTRIALAGSVPTGLQQIAYSGLASDVTASFTLSGAYTPENNSVQSHLEAIDLALSEAGKVETVNSQAPIGETKNVVIDASHIVTAYTFSAFTLSNDNSIKTAFSYIDQALQDAGKVESVNGVIPVEGSKNVLIDASDIIVPASFNEGYIVPDTLQTITAHFTAIDDAISALTLPASDILYTDEITAWSITSSSLSSIITGLNTKLADLTSLAFTADYADLQNVPTAGVNQVFLDTTADTVNMVAGRHYIVSTALNSIKVMNVPSLSSLVSNGDYIRITNWGNGIIRITETEEGSYLLNGQNIIGGATAGAYIEINARTTVDLYGFKLPPTYPVMWAAYYNTNIEINARTAIDGSILIFDQAKQEIVPSAYALSALAISGAAEDVIVAATPTNFTAATLTAQAFFDGIDEKLGELSLASGIAATFTPTGYITASSFVSDHLLGIDDKLSNLPVSMGSLGALNVADGEEKFIEVDWTVSDSAILPANNGTQYLGGVDNKLASLHATQVNLGANSNVLAVNVDQNLTFKGGLVKVEGSPLYDVVTSTSLATSVTLAKNSLNYGTGNASGTWTLPASPSEGVVVSILVDKDSTGTLTIAANGGSPVIEGGVASLGLQQRGEIVTFAWDAATSKWLYRLASNTAVRGAIQYVIAPTSNIVGRAGHQYVFANTTAATLTLPAFSLLQAGDKIVVTRGWTSTHPVAVVANAGDQVANLFENALRGYSDDSSVKARGESVTFMVNANKTKWLVVEDFVYDSVTTAISSPATMDEPNTTLVMANAGNATVTVPATSKFRNGDFFRVIAKGAKSVTLQLDQSDSGNVDFYAGSVNLGVNPTIQLSNGRAIYAIWSAGDASFYIESQLGTAASLDVGTSAGNLVQLDGTGKLPAIDGSQLTGIATGSGRLSISNETASFTAVKMKHHSVNTLAGSVTATLPLISTVDDADVIRIKLASRPGTNNLSVVASGADTIDGSSASILLQVQGEFIEVIANSATNNWEIIG